MLTLCAQASNACYLTCVSDTITRCYSRAVVSKFLSKGHISYHTPVRMPDFLRNVVVSGYVTLYEINKFFVCIYFFYYWQNVSAGLIKWLRGMDLSRET